VPSRLRRAQRRTMCLTCTTLSDVDLAPSMSFRPKFYHAAALSTIPPHCSLNHSKTRLSPASLANVVLACPPSVKPALLALILPFQPHQVCPWQHSKCRRLSPRMEELVRMLWQWLAVQLVQARSFVFSLLRVIMPGSTHIFP